MSEIRIITTEEQPTAVVRERVRIDALSAFFERAFTATMQALGEQGARPAGPPFAYYHGQPTDAVDVSAGFPVTEPIKRRTMCRLVPCRQGAPWKLCTSVPTRP